MNLNGVCVGEDGVNVDGCPKCPKFKMNQNDAENEHLICPPEV